jgi:hypothetical protein
MITEIVITEIVVGLGILNAIACVYIMIKYPIGII